MPGKNPHFEELLFGEVYMIKRVISIIISVAIIAGFAAVCSAGGYTTDNIYGKYKSHKETCTYVGVSYANKAVIGAEVFKNSKSLKAATKTWEGDYAVFYREISVSKLSANKGYHVGYYMIGNNMYYSRGYDYQ